MSIPEEIIEKIKTSNDLVAIAREYLPDLKKSGNDWKACCPFHHEKTPSFSISPERGIFKCFGCNAAGDVFKFVSMMDNISWIEAVNKLAQRASIEIQESSSSSVKRSMKTRVFEILESAANFYNKCLIEGKNSAYARNYLEKRGINKDSIQKFKIGYAPRGVILKAALKKGFSQEELISAGIIKRTDKNILFEYMADRLVFPIFDTQGRITAFGGRALRDDQQPKYLNTPETIVFSKSATLYGMFQNLPYIRKEKKAIIVEGYIDVVVPYQFGVLGAVAPLGTAFTSQHVKLLSRYADKIILLFDADTAGRNATQKALELLAENSIETVIASLPDDTDPDEYLNLYGKEKFLSLIEKTSKNAIDFMIDRVLRNTGNTSPQSRAKAISALLDFSSKSRDSNVQMEWIMKIAQRFNIDEKALRHEFSGLLKRKSKTNVNIPLLQEKKNDYEPANKTLLNSLEAQLLKLILFNRNLLKGDISNIFTEPLCVKIIALASENKDDTHIKNILTSDERDFFEALTLNPPKYKDINAAFKTIKKDLETLKLKKRAKELKNEVSLMLSAKKPKDDKKIIEYKELIGKLKGSRS